MLRHFLLDARALGSRPHGIARYLRALTRHLPAFLVGQRLSVLLSEPLWAERLTAEGWEVRPCPIRPYSLGEFLRLGQAVDEVGADLVHLPGFGLPRACRTPLIFTLHDLISYSALGDHPIKAALHRALVLQPWLARARAVIADTAYVAGQIDALAGRPLARVVPLGGDLETVAWPGSLPAAWKAPPAPYLLAMVNPRPHKNAQMLLRAFAKDAPGPLVLVGELRTRPPTCVVHLPQVDDVSWRELLRGCSGLLCPSLAEGFGLPLLEALYAGRPVAASDIPVLREWLGQRALWVENDDEAGWRAAAAKLLAGAAPDPTGPLADGRPASAWTWTECARATAACYGTL